MSANARIIGTDEFFAGGHGEPRIRFRIHMVKCDDCNEILFPSLEINPRFCPHCGTKLRFPKHMRPEDTIKQFRIERIEEPQQ